MLNQLVKTASGALIAATATMANAQNVQLNSLDGGMTLTGELIEFDGANYQLRTVVGTISVDAFKVECIGEACPSRNDGPVEYSISGSSRLVDSLFADLTTQFGEEIGGAALRSEEGGVSKLLLRNELGEFLAEVSLMGSDSTDGIKQLVDGKSALAVATRPVQPDELATATQAGLGDMSASENQKIFALDGLVAITSQSNPLRAVAEKDLARIFSGTISNWSQIGGPDAPIQLYMRAPDSGTGLIFDELIMSPAGANYSTGINLLETDAELAAAVASDPLGIGITSLASVDDAKVLAIRGVCGIQVPATPFTIKTEEYPLSRRLYAYTGNTVPAQLNRFIQFLETEKAQETIEASGFVSLGESLQGPNEQGLRYLGAVMPTDAEVTLRQLQEMSAELSGADRSSITFRFAFGSSRLDARAQDDIKRLAALLAKEETTNKELLLIGYTDSVGAGRSNRSLSQQRAQQVRNALQQAAPAGSLDRLTIRTLGYGEISPLSCNETENGRRINRRVEVWLRDTVTTSQ
ncbi:phosphate ABC transporter substrate-binding/OmpA family protein [uncultured Ruegeria sp.]|uniref:phosphate ABC transporter substrate-binding/OmpA family protein n=1 Tax=uncultured Ruegeria sp. TaxID=259304 RepID=UPI0026150142|nr:phosphate ABC transporter substrate-binding/OmpA family protein [uncultured Ruegeria sp.]